MKLLELLKRHATAVWLTASVLVLLGVVAAYDMPSGIYPEVEFPRIAVVARSGGAPPDVFLTEVTRPLEQALASTLGLQRIQSKTIRGATALSLQFAPGTDMWRALQLVEARVSETRASLPSDAEIIVDRVTTGSFPVVTMNVSGAVDPRELRELAELVIQPALANVPGVGRIEVLGGDIREYEVILDPDAVPALHLTPDVVATRLRDAMGLRAVGRVNRGQQLLAALGDAQPRTLQEIEEIPIATTPGDVLPVRSVAEVVEGAEDPTVRVGGPRGNTVAVSVARLPGASTPEVVRGTLEAVRGLKSSLPAGVTVVPVYDQASLVEDAMSGVRDAILFGIALCALVIAIFLRDVRAGIQAALAVPVTLAITFLCMRIGNQTMNLMSLGGMAVAIGLVVDDAIVVVEAIARQRDLGNEPWEAARLGTAELAPAVIGTTLTTVVVLFPLAFLSDIVGDFFRALSFTLTAAVLISLVVALVLIPLVPLRKAKAAPSAQGGEPGAFHSRFSRRLLRRPALTVVVFALIALSGVLIFPRVGRGFLPTMDEGAFVLDYFLPAGTSLEATETFARGLEGELKKTRGVLTFSRRLGAELGPATATELNRGDIMVRLNSRRTRSSDEIISELRSKIDAKFPEVRIEFVQVLQDVLNDLAGNPRPIEVKLLGPDFARLNEFGDRLAERLDRIPGLVDVYAGHEHEVPELRFRPRRDALARFGSSAEELSRQLETVLRGVVVGSVRRFDRLVNVRVRYPNPVRFDPLALLKTPFSFAGRTSTLEAMAAPELAVGQPELGHEGLSPAVDVTADLEGRDLGAVAAEVARAANELRLPTGYRAVIAGQLEGQRATLRSLSLVAAFALLLVLTVLSVQFRRVRLAFLVLLSVPLAIVGALFGLFMTTTPLNASSLMGIVLLVGLVVKNGVLLLEEAEKRFDRGESPSDALAGAIDRRVRPVIMTTAATLVGLLPLALGIGSGVELQRPLAIAVIFGLLSSTVATLALLPSLALFTLERARRYPPGWVSD